MYTVVRVVPVKHILEEKKLDGEEKKDSSFSAFPLKLPHIKELCTAISFQLNLSRDERKRSLGNVCEKIKLFEGKFKAKLSVVRKEKRGKDIFKGLVPKVTLSGKWRNTAHRSKTGVEIELQPERRRDGEQNRSMDIYSEHDTN